MTGGPYILELSKPLADNAMSLTISASTRKRAGQQRIRGVALNSAFDTAED
jgi:hypothetical protein